MPVDGTIQMVMCKCGNMARISFCDTCQAAPVPARPDPNREPVHHYSHPEAVRGRSVEFLEHGRRVAKLIE